MALDRMDLIIILSEGQFGIVRCGEILESEERARFDSDKFRHMPLKLFCRKRQF